MASIGRFAAFLSFAAHLHPILGLQSSYASTNRNDSSTDYTVGITSTTDGESSFIGSGTITVTAVVGNDGGIVRVPEGAYTDTDQVEHESWVEKTFDGPATFITTAVFDEYQTEVITFPRFKSSTTTVTVEWGNLAVNMLQDGFMSMSISSGWELWTSIEKFSTTTLAGPTTAILVARAPGTFDQPNYFLADDKNGFCVERLSLTEGPQYRTFRVKSAVGTLTPGETLTTQVRRDLWSSIYGYIPWALISTAFSQPGINYVTYTQTLSATLNREGDARDWIAERCIGRCWSCPDWGSCQDCHVYFESVDVHYWAVESPNTGCLISTSTTMLSHAEKFKRGMRAVVRSISKPVPGISTIVNDEGFTL